MKKLIELLNRQVANFGVFYIKLHNYHWFVKGPQFYQLHELFENLYDEMTGHMDEVAERILMLEEKPLATLKEFLQVATIKEASGNETNMGMVEAVLNDFKVLDKELADSIKLAQDLGDEVTVDMLLGMQSGFQKHIWMLKSVLK
ncbi:MAG: Dps family protein [Bacilli bacterium]